MDNIYVTKYNNKENNNTLNHFFSKILISIIFILSSLIYINLSDKNYNFYKKNILNSNIRYSKLKKISNKLFGNMLPLKNNNDNITVFNNSNIYKKIEPFNDGEKLIYDDETIVEALQSGIVVYVGDKTDLGYTVIVQGIDDVDIWYSNIKNCNLKLYDYIEKNKVIGEVDKELIINIIKDKNHIQYEEYLKTI